MTEPKTSLKELREKVRKQEQHKPSKKIDKQKLLKYLEDKHAD